MFSNSGFRLSFTGAFHRFGPAKFPDGGLDLGSSQITLLPKLPLKNGQN